MTAINALPKGLQEFLGNTSQGVNPSDLLQGVRPSFDMLPFWGADKLRRANLSALVTTPNQGGLISIPEGELWLPVSFSARMTGLAAGDLVRMGLEVWSPGGQRLVLEQGFTSTIDVPADTISVGFSWPTRVIYPGGWKFYATAQRLVIAAPSESIVADIDYYRMLG